MPLTHGEAVDRLVSSRRADAGPHPCNSPTRTPKKTSARVPGLRIWLQETPVQLATCRGLAPSTLHRILSAARLNRLSQVERPGKNRCVVTSTATPVGLIHIDAKKLGNIPDGGNWRLVGRQHGNWNRQATPAGKNKHHQPLLGHAFIHTVIDDHSHLAYTEVHDDKEALTTSSVLAKAVT